MANSCEIIQSHSDTFGRSGYTPLMARVDLHLYFFSPKIEYCMNSYETPTRQIVQIRMCTKQGVDNKDFKIPEQTRCTYLVVI